jgi:xylan 1,4-beta-xylosidase
MTKTFRLLATVAIAVMAHSVKAATPTAVFDWVEYKGEEQSKPVPGTYKNPILPGFQPDPSIVGVGKDFYLINSSFGFFPGIPIFHSRDLVSWTQIGNALDRPEQINLTGMGSQRAIFAPAITHHKGLFYIITTCVDCGGNFVITASDPKGPWSQPKWLDFEGIDPSIFVDSKGRGWVVNNGSPDGTPAYEGHRAIWIQELDLKNLAMKGPRKVLVNGGVDFSKKPIWIEGPHIYAKDGWYYLTAAEGGTAGDHSQTIFRSRNVTGPYVPGPTNPILTQRDLDPARKNAITATGHADFVQLPNGGWATVFLANRPYEGWLTNMGRETFLMPLKWKKGGWPEILSQGKPVPLTLPKPIKSQTAQTDWSQRRDEFNDAKLAFDWLSIRGRDAAWHSLTENKGALSLKATAEPITEKGFPAFLALRQRHHAMRFSTKMAFDPQRDGDRAGLLVFSDEVHNFFFGVEKLASGNHLVVRRRAKSADPEGGELLAVSDAALAETKSIRLHVTANGPDYSFSYNLGDGTETVLLKNADGRILATEYANLLFTGTIIGPYAVSSPR